jgi:hypothetical protein
MDDFTNGNTDDFDDFQELLDSLPELSAIPKGKRGSKGAKNNIGASVLSYKLLRDFVEHRFVDLTKKENRKGNFLYGIIDNPSVSRAGQIAAGIKKLSYPHVGVLAMAISKDEDGFFLVLWKGNIVDGVLSFEKTFSTTKEYRFGQNSEGINSFWRRNKNGEMLPFTELGTIVPFEEYLNAIVEETELPVSFPTEEISKLRGLSEVLANVNFNSNPQSSLIEDEDSENDDEEDEVEE